MNGKIAVKLTEKGTIECFDIRNRDDSYRIDFRCDEYCGPQWYGEWGGSCHNVLPKPFGTTPMRFESRKDDIVFTIEYRILNDKLELRATIRNNGQEPFEPVKAGLKLGLDTYMDSYPEWDQKYFPTLLRCEKTHFWGYTMSPAGKILGIASPDPVAAWSLDYNRINDIDLGHRIYTINLDLLNTLPLPGRHPQNMHTVMPGHEKQWTVYFIPIDEIKDLRFILAEICNAPMFESERYTLAKGECTEICIVGNEDTVLTVTAPDGSRTIIKPISGDSLMNRYLYTPCNEFGIYTLEAISANGKQSEAKIYLRRPWSWYLKQARKEAVNKPQKATTHSESWYGHFSTFLAKKYFPDTELDDKAEKNFRRILNMMYDIEKGEPFVLPERIQNTACMISLLVDVYEAGGEMTFLELASKLADWLISSQYEDGSYRIHGKSHYTSVVYMAKSMLELTVAEKKVPEGNFLWKQRYERHYRSAKAAVDDLERRKDNIGTEGEHTFEDGMISCTSLQLGMFALLQDDHEIRKRYMDAALYVLNKHRCLEQLTIPDCRMHGCTLRFWEAQYDVLIYNNMMNSPHGWTSWKTYATWYLYLLTGEEHFLKETMDTLGACMQVIDVDTGDLRWGFVPDPYIKASIWVEDEQNPGKGKRIERVIGEQYINMISGWWKAPEDRLVGGYINMPLITRDGQVETDNQGGCCDNDVHEHFKCLEEVALTSAYLLERSTGEIITWNCRMETSDHHNHIYPYETLINAIHINLKKRFDIIIHFADKVKISSGCTGLMWLKNDNDMEEI